MGLLDEYGIDTSAIEAPSFEIPDDWYEFTIGDVYTASSKADEDIHQLRIQYLLSNEATGVEGKKFTEFFTLPRDAQAMTPAEEQKMGFYVARILSLGFPRAQVNDVEKEDLIGIRGALQLLTKPGTGKNAGKSYQNIARLTSESEATESVAAPVKRSASVGTATTSGNPFAAK